MRYLKHIMGLAAVTALALTAFAGTARAGIMGSQDVMTSDNMAFINPATGLPWQAGDVYRLTFVTSGKTDATNTDISYYNTFAQDLANASTVYNIGAADGATWKVIASTNEVDARTNTATTWTDEDFGASVYRLDGSTVVARNYKELWNRQLQNTIYLSELGTQGYTGGAWPWTGTYWDGTAAPGHGASFAALGTTGNVHQGNPGSTTDWIWRMWAGDEGTNLANVYAMSDPLAVAPATYVYWDLNGEDAGAGGATPAGIWNAASANWTTASDGTATTEAWTAGSWANFAAGDASGAYIVTVDGTRDIRGLAFTSGTVTLTGGTALRMTRSAWMEVGSGLTATIETPITEDVAGRQLIVRGAGTLVLSAANTYTGGTVVQDGTLRLGAAGVAPDASADPNLPHAGAVTVCGYAPDVTARLDLNGYDETIGSLTLGGWSTTSGAAITTGAGTLTLGGDVTYDDFGYVFNPLGATISGRLDLGAATRIFMVNDSASATHDVTVSADISGTGVGLIKTGTGILVLSGANTYTAMTKIQAGALVFEKKTVLNGSMDNLTPTNVTVESGAALGIALGETASGYFGAADIDTVLDTSHMGSSTETTGMKPGAQIGLDTTNVVGGVFTRDTVIGDLVGGNSMGLAKLGTGTLILSVANTYTGGTTVNGGTLAYGANDVILDGDVAVIGGTLDLKTFSDTVGSVTLARGAIASTTGVLTITGDSVVQDGTVSATLAGSFNLTKDTSGTVRLERDNAYTGTTTLSDGTLQLASASSIGSGELALNGGFIEAYGATRTVANPITWGGDFGLGGSQDLNLTSTTAVTTGGRTITVKNTGKTTMATPLAVTGNQTFNFSDGSGDVDVTGLVTLTGSNRTFTVNATGTAGELLFSGGVAEDATVRGLTKAGTGVLVLDGVCTYTGNTVVNAGTLKVPGGLDGSDVTVNNDGTKITGGGVVKSLTINNGAGFVWGFGDGEKHTLDIAAGDLALNDSWVLKLVDLGDDPMTTEKYDLFTFTGNYNGSAVTTPIALELETNYTLDATEAGDWNVDNIEVVVDGGGYVYVTGIGITGMPGDADGDGDVDAADYIMVKTHFGGPPAAGTDGSGGDFNDNGTVDWDDLQTLMSGLNSSTGGAPIPEPATMIILAAGLPALLKRRRSRS